MAAAGTALAADAAPENIQVAVRMRPLMGAEVASGDVSARVVDARSMRLTPPAGGEERNFTFDLCQDAGLPNAQSEFFEKLGSRMVEHSLKGYNVSIFACEEAAAAAAGATRALVWMR